MKAGVDYIGVGVGAIIFDDEGKVFLAKRGPKATNERGCWEFPGGKVNFNEKLTDAIQRELREEYGIEIEILAMLGIHDHILPEEKQHWVSPTFLAQHINGEARILEPEKCEAIGWFSLDALPSPLSVISQDDVTMYTSRYGNKGFKKA